MCVCPIQSSKRSLILSLKRIGCSRITFTAPFIFFREMATTNAQETSWQVLEADSLDLRTSVASTVSLLEQERLKLEEKERALELEKNDWEETTSKYANVVIKSPVTLDVGGARFKTSLTTLRSQPRTFFKLLKRMEAILSIVILLIFRLSSTF